MLFQLALMGALCAPIHTVERGKVHATKIFEAMHTDMDSIDQDLERVDTSGDIPEMDLERKKKDKKKKKKDEEEEEMPIGLERFAPRWTGKEKEHALDTLKKFTDILKDHNIPYTLWAGTLLGAVRHHDVIPWDDDMDMAVPIKFFEELRDPTTTLRKQIDAAGIGMIENPFQRRYNGAFKIFSKDDPLIGDVTGQLYHAGDGKDYPINWAWPFTDVFMFKENHQTGKVSITRQEITKHQLFDMEQFFPLTDQCKLGQYTFQCVANPKAVLSKKFGPSYLHECIADTFDHHHFQKRKGPWVGLPCDYVNSHMMMTSEMPKAGGASKSKQKDDVEQKESVME